MKGPISKIDPSELTLNDKLVYINRVAKVVKGGKRLSFSALVVTGDGTVIIEPPAHSHRSFPVEAS